MSSIRINSRTYDDVFLKTGHGLWQYLLLLQCGWANASDAIEIMCISFILPHIKSEMSISYAQLSGLTFALFFGMMIGGYIWGSIADSHGRRYTICFSLSFNAVFGMISAVSPNYLSLLLFRFLSGVGAGGSIPVCFTYFSEFQQVRHRGAMVSALAMCWMFGNLISGLLACIILPKSSIILTLSPSGQQWRLFTLLCGIPSLSSAILFIFMPESPKFLFTAGKVSESIAVLKKVFSWNHIGKNDRFDIEELSSYQIQSQDESISAPLLESSDSTPDKINHKKQFKVLTALGTWKNQMNQVFLPCRRTHSIAIMFISVMVAFGGYGMGMWMPVLMERAEQYDGSPCFINNDNVSESTSSNSSKLYIDVLIGFLGQVPGNIMIILLMDRVGAKSMMMYSAFLSGLSTFFFWATNSKATVIAMNTIFNGISVGCWDAIDVLLVEMYPTSIRSAATGNANGISRLGAILGTAIFGAFMDQSCSVPIITVFIVYTLAAIASCKLPDNTGKTQL